MSQKKIPIIQILQKLSYFVLLDKTSKYLKYETNLTSHFCPNHLNLLSLECKVIYYYVNLHCQKGTFYITNVSILCYYLKNFKKMHFYVDILTIYFN